eukprot:g7237.t1
MLVLLVTFYPALLVAAQTIDASCAGTAQISTGGTAGTGKADCLSMFSTCFSLSATDNMSAFGSSTNTAVMCAGDCATKSAAYLASCASPSQGTSGLITVPTAAQCAAAGLSSANKKNFLSTTATLPALLVSIAGAVVQAVVHKIGEYQLGESSGALASYNEMRDFVHRTFPTRKLAPDLKYTAKGGLHAWKKWLQEAELPPWIPADPKAVYGTDVVYWPDLLNYTPKASGVTTPTQSPDVSTKDLLAQIAELNFGEGSSVGAPGNKKGRRKASEQPKKPRTVKRAEPLPPRHVYSPVESPEARKKLEEKLKGTGVTLCLTKEDAKSALKTLRKHGDRPHFWDTESMNITLGRLRSPQSPLHHGECIVASCFIADDVDFGSGPKLFIDNYSAEKLLATEFKGYFEDARHRKVFHNFGYDYKVLKRAGIKLQGFLADTLHLARLQDSSLANWEQDVRFLDEANKHSNQESLFEAETTLRDQLMENMLSAGVTEERDDFSGYESRSDTLQRAIKKKDRNLALRLIELVRTAEQLEAVEGAVKNFRGKDRAALTEAVGGRRRLLEHFRSVDACETVDALNKLRKRWERYLMQESIDEAEAAAAQRLQDIEDPPEAIKSSGATSAAASPASSPGSSSSSNPKSGTDDQGQASPVALFGGGGREALEYLEKKTERLKHRNKEKGKMRGYGLKHLVRVFGDPHPIEPCPMFLQDLVLGIPRQRKVAKHEQIEFLHTDEYSFANWVLYATSDARYTGLLFFELQRLLEGEKWKTSILPPCSAHNSMWTFYQEYYLKFGGLLNDMECRGVPIDVVHLEKVEREATADCKKYRHEIEAWIREHLPAMKEPEMLNLGSPEQYGGIRCSSLTDWPRHKTLRVFLYGNYCAQYGQRGHGFRNQKDRTKLVPPKREFTVEIVNDVAVAEESAQGAGGVDESPDDDAGRGSSSTSTASDEVDDAGTATVSDNFAAATTATKPKRGKKTFLVCGLNLRPPKIDRDFIGTGGWPKTCRLALERLRDDCARHPYPSEQAKASLLDNLIKAKQAQAMLTYFIKPLRTLAANDGGRIHPSLMLDTSTGRLACRSPNLQNQPALDKDVYQVRRAIRASPDNCLVVCDFSQLELRVFAHESNCRSMIEKFASGGDFHSETAAEMYPSEIQQRIDDPGDDFTIHDVKEQFGEKRKAAKTMNFGIAYGRSAFSIGKELDVSTNEAEEVIESWYRSKPEVSAWKRRIERHMRVHKKTVSIFGRNRLLPHVTHPDHKHRMHSERAGINHMIQGSAADIVMLAMLKIDEHEQLRKWGFQLILQIHDEVILEGPAAYGQQALEIVKDCMANPFPSVRAGNMKTPSVDQFQFGTQLVVDGKVGETWYDCK